MLKLVRLLAWTLTSAALAVVLAGVAGRWLYRDARRAGPLTAAKTVVIPEHTGLRGIADLLARDGVVRNPWTFVVIAELSGRGHRLKSGEYAFPAATSSAAALAIIAAGRSITHKLTIPEGLTSPEIIALVRAAPALAGDPGPVPPEGSLYPDTYIYSWGEPRRVLIGRMQHAMAYVVSELWRQRFPALRLATPEAAVALASIVEKETAVPAERAHIAGVYINRLKHDMPLDADPTVLFALEDGGAKKLDRPLDHADLAIASPYNTYRNKGLPPGPIDNPGRASLQAAMQPEPTDDLYFVADGAGGHVFAKTLAGQTQNIDAYLKPAVPAVTAAVAPAVDPLAKPPPAPPPKPPPVQSYASAPSPQDSTTPSQHPVAVRPAIRYRHRRIAWRRVAHLRYCHHHPRACHTPLR
jgi:UPF0755 protein